MFQWLHELTRLLDELAQAKKELDERRKHIETINRQGFGLDTATYTVAATMLADSVAQYAEVADQVVTFYNAHKDPSVKTGILNDLDKR